MKVLMLSGDARLLEAGSAAQGRLELQRASVDQLDVLVWPKVHSWWEVWRAPFRTHYDVITVQDPFWRGAFGVKLAFWTGTKLNVQVHTDLSNESLPRRLLARFVLRSADSIRVVSEKLAGQVRAMGVRAPTHVLPIFLDGEAFRAVARESHEQKTILWIGRLEREKNPCQAIEVLQEVRTSGVDAKLVILGAGSEEALLREKAQGLPVEFVGWQDPKEYLGRADVVLSTSRFESWGASIVEALAAQVPVVAPDVGVAREAGAIVVERSALAQAVVETVHTGVRGALRLTLPDRATWAKQWRETLLG